MPIIGIIAKESDSNFIKNEIMRNAKNNKFKIINLNKESIQNLKNTRFDTLVISEDTDNLLKISKYLEDIIQKLKFLIINSDAVSSIDNLNNNVIKYGLNHEADITVSSIKKENILICIQKKIKDISGNFIEEQEFNLEMSKNSLRKIYNSMAIFTFLAIYGEVLEKI